MNTDLKAHTLMALFRLLAWFKELRGYPGIFNVAWIYGDGVGREISSLRRSLRCWVNPERHLRWTFCIPSLYISRHICAGLGVLLISSRTIHGASAGWKHTFLVMTAYRSWIVRRHSELLENAWVWKVASAAVECVYGRFLSSASRSTFITTVIRSFASLRVMSDWPSLVHARHTTLTGSSLLDNLIFNQ